jgi:hypothetical protein
MGQMEDWLRKAAGAATSGIIDAATQTSVGDLLTAPLNLIPVVGNVVGDWTEDKIDDWTKDLPGFRQANFVLDSFTSDAWQQAERTGSYKDVKAALDATGNDVESIGKYLGKAIFATPEFLYDWHKDVAISSMSILPALASGDSGKSKDAVFNFGKALLGPLFYIASEPIEDVHGYQGEMAYKFATTGSWEGGGGIGLNLPSEYLSQHPEEKENIKRIYEQGYDSNGDGQIDFTGGRAVWEYIIGKQNRATRIFFEVVNDPWNATVVLGIGQAVAKGAARGMVAGSPRAAKLMFGLADALGTTGKAADLLADFPLWAAGQAAKRVGLPVAKKVAPTLTQNIGQAFTNSPVGRLFQPTNESVATTKANDVSDALNQFAGEGNIDRVSAIYQKHASKVSRTTPLKVNPGNPTGRYEVINLGNRNGGPLWIQGPDGMPMPGFDIYVGKGREKQAISAAQALNKYMEDTGQLFPRLTFPPQATTLASPPPALPATTGAQPTAAAPNVPTPATPAPVTPTPIPPGSATTPPINNPGNGIDVDPNLPNPPGNLNPLDLSVILGPELPDDGTLASVPEIQTTLNDLDADGSPDIEPPTENQYPVPSNRPNWYEFRPNPDDISNQYPLTRVARELRILKGNAANPTRVAQFESFFRGLGIDPDTYNLIPDGPMAKYEQRRKALQAMRFAPGQGGFDRKVFLEALLARLHFVFEIQPAYKRATGNDIEWAVSPEVMNWTADDVKEAARDMYKRRDRARRARSMRNMIDAAMFLTGDPMADNKDSISSLARAVLGRHGWPDSKNGKFLPWHAYKHEPDPLLGFSGGETLAIWDNPVVRAIEDQYRNEMSPMDWIGTVRRVVVHGRDTLASLPDPTISPLNTASTQTATRDLAAELRAATQGTKITPEQADAGAQLLANMDRAVSKPGETSMSGLRFERGVDGTAAQTGSLSQMDESADPNVIDAPAHRMDLFRDPEIRRAKIADAIRNLSWARGGSIADGGGKTKMFWGNIINRDAVKPIAEDLIDAFVRNDREAFDAIISASSLTPREKYELRTNFWDKLSSTDAMITKGIGNIDSGTTEIPPLKTYDDVKELMSQPVPAFLIEADMKLAVEKYPGLSPEQALARLRKEGGDEFSRISPIRKYTYYTKAGKKKIAHHVAIPGSFNDNGKWSYWELAIIEAQGLNPAEIPWKDRVRIYKKIFRSMDRPRDANGNVPYDAIDIWTRLGIGVTSSSTALYPNLRIVAALRPTSQAELEEMAQFVERMWPEWAQAMRNYQFEPVPGQLGGGLPPELQRTAKDYQELMAAYLKEKGIPWSSVTGPISDNVGRMISFSWYLMRDQELVRSGAYPRPVFGQLPGENPISYTDRLSAILPGLQSKTANFGAMLGDPANWHMGTMDVHMMRWLKDMVDYYQDILTKPEIYDQIPDAFKENGRVRIPDNMLVKMKSDQSAFPISRDGEDPVQVFVLTIKNASGKKLGPPTNIKGGPTYRKEFDTAISAGESAIADPRKFAVQKGIYKRNTQDIGETVDYGAEYWPLSNKADTRSSTKGERARGIGPTVTWPSDFTAIDDEYEAASLLTTVVQNIMAEDLGLPELMEFTPGGFQWFIWDGIRGVLETHPIAFPNLKFLPKKPVEDWKADQIRHGYSKDYGLAQAEADTAITDVYRRRDVDPNAEMVTQDGEVLEPGQKAMANASRVMGGSAITQDPARVMRQFDDKIAIENGSITFTGNSRALVRFFEKANASTIAHEGIHYFRRQVDAEDADILNKFVGAADADSWTVDQEEMLARAFEKYLRDPGGKYAQSLPLETRNLFSQFRTWMIQIYQRVKGTAIDVELNPDVENVFGRLTSGQTKDEWAAFQASKKAGRRAPAAPNIADAADAVDNMATPPSNTLTPEEGASVQSPLPETPEEVTVPESKNPAVSTDPADGTGFRVEEQPTEEEILEYTIKMPEAPEEPLPTTPTMTSRERAAKNAKATAQMDKALLSRVGEEVDIEDFETWTPLFFSGVMRLIEKESFNSLPAFMQDALLDGKVVTIGKAGVRQIDKDALARARRVVAVDADIDAYAAMADLATRRKWNGSVTLLQVQWVGANQAQKTPGSMQVGKKTVPVSNAPIGIPGPAIMNPNFSINPILDDAVKRKLISEADARMMQSQMPDELGGETVFEAYYDALSDGLSEREAIARVTGRVASFYRMNTKQQQYLLQRNANLPVGKVGRILRKMSAINRVSREGQMYSAAKVVTRPLSDYSGNTVHMAISGNYTATKKQIGAIPEAIRIAIRAPKDAALYLDKTSSPVLSGLDVDMPASITGHFSNQMTKFGQAGEELFMAKVADKYNLKFGRFSPLEVIASPRVQAMGNAMDMMSKKNLAESVMDDRFIDQAREFVKDIEFAGSDGWKVYQKSLAEARKRTGNPNVRTFAPRDVKAATGSDGYADMWSKRRDIIKQQTDDELKRVMFVGSEVKNYEQALGHLFYYYFWQSRSLGLAARASATNPLLLSSYIKMWNGLENEAERNGYPKTFIGTMSFWGNPNSPLGWFGLTNAVGILVPGFMMSEWYDINRASDEQTWFERLSTIAPATSMFGGALASLGWSDEVPSLIGSRQLENIVLSVIDWGKSNGMDLTNGQPAESVIRNVEEYLLRGVNGVMREVGWGKRYTPYAPESGKKDTIKSVIWSNAVRDWGADIETWNVDQWEELSIAMTVVDEGLGESPRAEEAFREWSSVMVASRVANVVVPGGSIPRYGPREAARNAAKKDDDQARTQRDIVRASPQERDRLIEEQQAESTTTIEQRAANDYYSLIAYRIADDVEAYPDNYVLPTAIGPITAGALRQMTEEERRTVASGILEFSGMTADYENYQTQIRAARESGQFPEFTAYKDYQSFVRGYTGGARAFREWAANSNPSFAQSQEEAMKRWQKQNPGGDVEEYLDGWAFSARAYSAFRNRPATMYDPQPEGVDMGIATSGRRSGSGSGGFGWQERIAYETENANPSAALANRGLGYRPRQVSSEAMRFSNWRDSRGGGTVPDWMMETNSQT